MDEQTYRDFEIAEEALSIEGRTLVLVDNAKVFSTYTDHPVPFLCTDIEYLPDVVVGIDFLGKAGALLCAYARVRAVFTKQATKTALAVLIRAGIPCQTEKMIPLLPQNSPYNDVYEQRVQGIDNPEEWFIVLKKRIMNTKE